jgi:hypothetical protein
MLQQQRRQAVDEASRTDADADITDRLDDVRRNIEGKFLAAGDILIKSIDGTKSLIASLDNLATTFNSEIVAQTKADLTVAASKLYMLPTSHAERVGGISRLNRTREDLARRTADMRCSLSYMRAFSLNIKIVAGSLGEEFRDFDMFAQDMSECITRGSEELKKLETELATLQRSLSASITQGDILGMQIGAMVPVLPDELTADASIVTEHYQSVIDTTEKVSVLANNIQKRVACILGAMQIGDITRQRIEHLQECIIRQQADKAAMATEEGDRYAATCYALIATHLTELTSDFDREVAEIERNMADMAVDAGELLKLHSMAFDSEDGGFLHRLGQRIETAVKLVDAIDLADKAAVETGENTAKITQQLSARIEQIQILKNDVQYMALNTTLKCCQIGDTGRPLSVIALEIREHSKQLEKTALDSLSSLDQLMSLTEAISTTGKAENPAGSNTQAAAAALDIAMRRLNEVRDVTENNLAEIASKGDDVHNMLSLSAERLRFREEIGEILAALTEKTENLKRGAYADGAELPPKLKQMLTDYAGIYTMQQERNVHAAFIQSLGIEADEPAAATPSPVDEDDVLF